jgi:hypothetical protein
MDENMRIPILRQQDGRPMLRPPGLESVVDQRGGIEAWKMNEAWMVWGQTRRHLAQMPADIAAAERLMFLTVCLSNVLAEKGDLTGLRALYEGALEVVSLPRHRQSLRGFLTRNAAKHGDLESAQAWLAGCDPGSDELETDSPYRVSAAYLATARGDFNAVLQFLGPDLSSVPIADSMDGVATVLRANAFEKMGHVDAARGVLAELLNRHKGSSALLEGIIKIMPPAWNACAQAMQGARQDHRKIVAAQASGGAVLGYILIGAGCLPLVIMTPLALFTDAPIFMPIFSLPFVFAFGGWGLKTLKHAKRQEEIAKSGVSGQGKVLSLSPTGVSINDVPEMRIDMELKIPGQGPLRASTKKIMMPHQAAGLVGQELPVIWTPAHPEDVVLELLPSGARPRTPDHGGWVPHDPGVS